MIAKSDDKFVTHNMKWGYTDLISIRFCRRKSASYYFICKYRKNVLGCVYKYVKNVWCIYVKFLIVLYVLVFTVQEVEYIENTTWSRGDMEFIFECSHRYRTSERSERVRYRMWTREDKFHISKRPCIILFII